MTHYEWDFEESDATMHLRVVYDMLDDSQIRNEHVARDCPSTFPHCLGEDQQEVSR